MAANRNEYVTAMREFPAAVNIVTTTHDGERAGLTATAAVSLTADPPQFGVAVNRDASAYPLIVASGIFCVNTLSAEQNTLARLFAGAIKSEQRFQHGEWYVLETGAPVLRGALINLDCRVERAIEFSTHTLFVGSVEAVETSDTARPLLFVDGDWASLLPATGSEMRLATGFMERSIAAVDSALAGHDDPNSSLSEFVRQFTLLNIDERQTMPEHLNHEFYALPNMRDSFNDTKREFDERFLELIQRGIESEDFDVDDPRIATFAIIGMIVWTFKWYREDGRMSSEEVAEVLARYARKIVGTSGSDREFVGQHKR